MPSKYAEDCATWETIKAKFITDTHSAMMRDPSCRRRYAYFRESDVGTWGQLIAVTEYGEVPIGGFQLVTAEAIPAGTKEQIRHWLERFSERLPVFPR